MIPKQRRPVTDDDGQPYPAETLAAAIAGDRNAFGAVWAAHRLEVFRIVYYRVSSYQLAEDITSETCLRAMRKIGGFSPNPAGGGLPAWLTTIARNLIADHFKCSRSKREITTADMLDADQAVPGPEDIVVNAIATATIQAAVDALNPYQRACVEARFLDQLSIAETADRLGRLDGAIKTLQYRAVRTLARDPRLTPEMLT